MRAALLIFPLFLFTATCIGQTTFGHDYFNCVKIAPYRPFGIVSPSIEVGYERSNGRWSTEFTAAQMLKESVWFLDTGSPRDAKGFRFALGQKLLFGIDVQEPSFFGLEIDYLNRRYNELWEFGVQPHWGVDSALLVNNYVDSFRVHRQTTSVNLIWGKQYTFGQLLFEFYLGLGVRYRDVRHSQRIESTQKMVHPRTLNIFYSVGREGHSWSVSVPFNFRVGWCF